MILDLDIGNTRIKWCLHRGDCRKAIARGAALHKDGLGFLGQLPDGVERVRVVSVVTGFHSELRDRVAQRWRLEPEWARVESGVSGVTCGYSRPAALGVDRWLAILGARQLADGDLLVVSAGSAVTIDLCREKGVHEGGYIFPGLTMMAESLISGTAGVRPDELPAASLKPGRTTAQAVAGGALAAAAGAVRLIWEQSLTDAVVVTGGDGKQLVSVLGMLPNVIDAPDLVFTGLSIALP